MEVPGLSSRVHEEVESKPRLNPEDDTPTKRRQRPQFNGESATRPKTSGELLWGSSYTKTLYCSEEDKDIFRIRFSPRRNRTLATETESLCHATRRSTVKELKYYGKVRSNAMGALLAGYGLWPRRRGKEPKLHLRYGGSTSVVKADGVFHAPSRGLVVAVADLANMAERRTKHPMTLLPEAKREKKECRERRAEEHLRIKPKKAEEDTQIALMMVAMVQEMLRSGDRNQAGAWARVIGIGEGKIYLYRSWVPRRFVETFKADNEVVVRYRSVSLKDEARVIEQLGCLLKERGPPSVQPGAAAAA